MNEKILVPLDGSAHSFKALRFACDLAQKYGSALTLLHVVRGREIPEAVREFVEIEHVDAPPEWVYEQVVADKVLGKAEQAARERGIQAAPKVVAHGDPAKAIVDVARDEGVDLVVMGTRGLSELKGLVVGSVAHKVSHFAPCTVITVR